MSSGEIYILFVLLVVWFGDIAALYAGKAIGKHKLAPTISPNKTWEGAIASVIAATAVGATVMHYGLKTNLEPHRMLYWSIAALITNIAAQILVWKCGSTGLGDVRGKLVDRACQVQSEERQPRRSGHVETLE